MKDGISFQFNEGFSWLEGLNDSLVASWLIDIVRNNHATLEELTYVFGSDDFVLELNKKHLGHDYYTDILTFPYSYEPISAEIYISIDRLMDNASEYSAPILDEWLRVIVHGLLHMMHHTDKTSEEQEEMRLLEDRAITKFHQIAANE